MSQLGPEPNPERDALIVELLSMATQALGGPTGPDTPIQTGWQTLHFGDLVVRGLPPDDIEIRLGTTRKDLVYATVHKAYSIGTKESIERSIEILRSHFVLEALARI